MGLDRLWSISGSVALPAIATGTIIDHIGARLEPLKLDHLQRSDLHLEWRQGFVRFITHLDWELLGGIDSGAFVVRDNARLTYSLHFRHVLILCAVASIFAGLFQGTAPDATPIDGLRWGLFAMLALYGANYAVTIFQVRRFLRKAIDALSRDEGPSGVA